MSIKHILAVTGTLLWLIVAILRHAEGRQAAAERALILSLMVLVLAD